METRRVEGADKGKLTLYALSTCIWCRMLKNFLSKHGIGYDYVDVDTLGDQEKAGAINDLKHWNPKCSFPSLVINDEKCVIGFNEDNLKEALKL